MSGWKELFNKPFEEEGKAPQVCSQIAGRPKSWMLGKKKNEADIREERKTGGKKKMVGKTKE